MIGPLALSAALLAFFGAAHCAAMCGGFVAATFATPGATRRGALLAGLALHAGRLASYATAGAIAGALGATPGVLFGSNWGHVALFAVASAVLVVTGLRIAGVRFPALTVVTGARPPWRRAAASASARLGAPDAFLQRLGVGCLWGWAPCAVVYSALPLAFATGSMAGGALVMLAFGIGTLPGLLGAGWLLARGARLWPGAWARRIAGGAIVVLAIAGLLQALGLADTALGAFCVAPLP